jgi:ankyrin repeat protein
MTCLGKRPLILGLLVALACVLGSTQAGAQDYDLVKAASAGDLPHVKAQLASGADPNQVDSSEIKGWTALMAAAGKGRITIAEVLLRAC